MRFSTFTPGCKRSLLTFLMLLFVGLYLAGSPLEADEDEYDVGAPLEAGEVMPLDRLLARIRRDVGGRVLKVELERETDDGPGWLYEAKVLTPEGHVLKLEYDAKTLELLEIKGRHGRRHDDDDD